MRDVSMQFLALAEAPTVDRLFNSAGYENDGVALALSGGGYKAAAYHLGGLVRLNQLGYLPKVRRISSVSGGSITAAYLGLMWSKLEFDQGVATNFHNVIVQPLQEFLIEVNLDIIDIFSGLLNPFRTEADALVNGYDKHLFKGATLQDLPEATTAPDFTLVATNFELNSLWRFSKAYAADYRVGRINRPTFSLARIVAASSGFPPFFCRSNFSSTSRRECKGGRTAMRAASYPEPRSAMAASMTIWAWSRSGSDTEYSSLATRAIPSTKTGSPETGAL